MNARKYKALSVSLLNGFLIVAFCVASSSAHAGVYLETTFLPAYTQSNTGVGSLGGTFSSGGDLSAESGFSYDLRATVGYSYRRFLLGFSYNYLQAPLSRDASTDAASLDRNTSASEMGVSFGYLFRRIRLVGTYFFSGTKKRSERQVQDDGTVLADFSLNNKKGQGYQFTFGYDFNLTSKFKIGPTLVYRHVAYSTQTLVNDVDPSADYSNQKFTKKAIESNLQPMISLVYQF
jgi:hypothetical protein